jgi:hypothetical protein
MLRGEFSNAAEATTDAPEAVESATVNGNTIADESSSDRVLLLGLGHWASRALLCAIELGVFSALASGPLDCEGLCERLRLDQRRARDFLDVLVALRLLDRRGGFYRNTRHAQLHLDCSKPSYLGDFLDGIDRRLYTSWKCLPDVLKSTAPQPGVRKGGELFIATHDNPAAIGLYLRETTRIVLPCARALARRFPWTKHRTFADIGAAEGALAVEVARGHPHLTGVGLDRPAVRPAFDAYVRRHGMGPRLRFHAGDMVGSGPFPSADVLVLSEILCEWDLDTKLALLTKAYAALPQGGVLIVCDQMIDDERRNNIAALLTSLNMRMRTPNGFGYTGANCLAWMREAGFSGLRRDHLYGPYSVVVGTKQR